MEGRWLHNIMHSKGNTFFACCLVFLVATAVALLGPKFSWNSLYALWWGSGILLFFFWNNRLHRFILLVCWIILLAVLRVLGATPDMSDQTHIVSYLSKEVTITGVLNKEPDKRISYTRYTLGGARITYNKKTVPVHGNVQFTTFPYPPHAYGEHLSVHCTLKKPQSEEGFRYDLYLASQDIFVTCTWPQITVLDTKRGGGVFRYLFQVKEFVAKKIAFIWPEPYAGFVAGLLYGYRGGLGSLDPMFRQTGITHLVAVSGQNIVILAGAILSCCFRFRIRRPRALIIVALGVLCFVIFTGASASVVRAGIMAGIVFLSEWLGRGRAMKNVLGATAATMVFFRPHMLLYDPGFILSFLATIGIIYATPWMKEKLSFVPDKLKLQEIFGVTLSAILWTLPYGLYQFGTTSLVAPIVNALVGPLVPLIMGLSAFAVFLSIFSPSLGLFLGFISYAVMKITVAVVTFFAHIPYASVELSVPIFMPAIGYGVLVWFFLLKKKEKNRL